MFKCEGVKSPDLKWIMGKILVPGLVRDNPVLAFHWIEMVIFSTQLTGLLNTISINIISIYNYTFIHLSGKYINPQIPLIKGFD